MKARVRALLLEKDKIKVPPGTEMMKEKDSLRGYVPATKHGIRDTVYGAYLADLSPRDNPIVQKALAQSEDPRFKEFLERIKMNRYKRISLQTIAKSCGIDLAEFGTWFNKASTQEAISTAQRESVNIVKDMVEDAKSVRTACDRCDGMTWVSAPAGLPPETPGYRSMVGEGNTIFWIRDCPVCTDGKVRKPGDAHARDRTLEIAGMLKKGPGLVINQNFAEVSHQSAVGELDCMTMDATFESQE